MTKVSKIKESGDTLTFTLSNTNCSIANAIRRVLIAEITTWAFDKITVEENFTPFSDEYLSHRVGLIPINNELVNEDSPKEFFLDAKGSKDGLRKVYSQEITPKNFVFPGIVVAELKGMQDKQEHLKMKMTINQGSHMGNDAKYSAVTVATYDQVNSTTFDFEVENRGVMQLNTLIHLGFDVIIEKLTLIYESIDKPSTTKLSFETTATDLYNIRINDEDDTVGNLVQVNIMNKNKDLFVAYHRPHPLENHVVVSIKDPNAKDIFKNSLVELIKMFNSIKSQFKN